MRWRPARGIDVVLALALGPALLAADTPPPEKRQVVPGAHYRAGGLHRFVFGAHYRTLWATPLQAEVLDLATFSGGLKPDKKGGGRQTKALKFDGADGREWKFRSLDKDPSAVLPPELRGTFVDAIVQDQISAANPAGALVADALAGAAGIPHVTHRLVILPDDPALGEFRQEFAGLLGLLEEEIRLKEPVTPGFEEYTKLLDTTELWEHLDQTPGERVDARAFLKARLFDVFLGDFDRHKDQWQWGRRRGSPLWEPVPEDRDQAFAKYDGLALWLVRPSQPDLVDFGSEYPSIFGLTRTGRFLDRRHLSELDWPAWEQVTADLQGRLTDAAIEEAVRRLPAEHYRLAGRTLAERLKSRRERLPRAARRFYDLLAGEVEVHGTHAAETVEIVPGEDRTVLVRIEGEDGEPRYRRSFRPAQTSEVRLFLKGGNDRVVRAPGTAALTVRVVGGPGDDVLDDSRAGHTRFYDEEGANRVLPGPGTRRDGRPYAHPPDRTGNPARDWGRAFLSTPLIGGGGDLGLMVGGRVTRIGYGFRKHPYSSRHSLRAGWAFGRSAASADYEGEVYRTNSRTRGFLWLHASEVDVLRFYGPGNETSDAGGEEFFHVEQRHLLAAPALRFGSERVEAEVGAVVSHSRTPAPPDRFIGVSRPYGVGDFGQAGLRARVTLGQRDLGRKTSSQVWVGGAYYPELWDVESHYGALEGQAVTFLRFAEPLQLGLRVGGKKLLGAFPFQQSAFIGGPETVRGLPEQRYAGEASAFASAELHLRLGEVGLLLPTSVGLLGFADTGRVWAEGETSDTWHTGVGGGIWLSPLSRSTSLNFVLARSQGRMRWYLQAGYGF